MKQERLGIKILIIDDHALFGQSLENLLGNEEDMNVVGRAVDGVSGLTLAEKLMPDVVLLDISMPKMDGLEVIVRIKKANPEIKIIMLSMHKGPDYVYGSLQNGAKGYLLKDTSAAELFSAIRKVHSGGIYLCSQVSEVVVEGFVGNQKGQIKSPASEGPSLSTREKEVLKLIAEGKKSKEIAETLHISPRTVEVHKRNMMDKLKVHSIAELVQYAIKLKLVDLNNDSAL